MTGRGLSVWTPDEELLLGDNPYLQIGDALAKSNAMVVLISPESMRSDNVRREIEYALGCERYAGRVFAVEVRPTEYDDVFWSLRKFRTFKAAESPAKISAAIADALKKVA